MRLIKILKNRRGMSLVEVITAFALMLLVIGIFAGAINFSGAMARRADATRAQVSYASWQLRVDFKARPSGDKVDDAVYRFSVAGVENGTTLFEVATRRVQRTVTLSDGSTYTFWLFEPEPEGGDAP